jgi:hypothetical protein
MRMVKPFQFEKPSLKNRKILFAKSDQRLILVWPFGETNAAAQRARNTPAGPADTLRRR